MVNFKLLVEPHVVSHHVTQIAAGVFQHVIKTSCGGKATGTAGTERDARSTAELAMLRNDTCNQNALGGAK